MDDSGLHKLKNMYEKLNYFDQYGGSVVLFIIITILVSLVVSYCAIMVNAQPIIDDWTNQRCKPSIIPFAGFITHPDGVSASDYTYQNFTFCTQNIISSITGEALSPLTFITSVFTDMTNKLNEDTQNARNMMNKVRTNIQGIVQEIMGRVMNITIPIQQIIISLRDMMSKAQGTMTAGLFTLLGSYYTLKSLMGAIAQFIITILITLAALIAGLWIVPLTWGAAAANTAIFVAISIPMAIILVFMKDVLNVHTNLKMPSVKCFDKDTFIEMSDGTHKKIVDVRLGDKLEGDNEVTARFKLTTKGSVMYNLDGVVVSDSHIMKYFDKWISVALHPHAKKIDNYDEPYLYCLNTSNKTIKIKNYIFTDWDEVYGIDLQQLLENKITPIPTAADIHTLLDGGFCGTTQIQLKNGKESSIRNIKVGDILENGEEVYGVVEINGENLYKQFKYQLDEHTFIEGYNLNAVNNSHLSCKIEVNYKNVVLYHLLTDTQKFNVNKICFRDYNYAIDLFLTNE